MVMPDAEVGTADGPPFHQRWTNSLNSALQGVRQDRMLLRCSVPVLWRGGEVIRFRNVSRGLSRAFDVQIFDAVAVEFRFNVSYNGVHRPRNGASTLRISAVRDSLRAIFRCARNARPHYRFHRRFPALTEWIRDFRVADNDGLDVANGETVFLDLGPAGAAARRLTPTPGAAGRRRAEEVVAS